MRPGTPGFSGARLREAREARGLSVISLAEVANVSTQSIYHYENGRYSPGPEVLRQISSACNLPDAFFFLPEREKPRRVFYRSMSAATKTARSRAEHRFGWFHDLVLYVSEFVALPEGDFPKLDLANDPLLISDEEIDEAADEVRRAWRMTDGPVSNMVFLLENHGAVIARDHMGALTLDSMSDFVAEENRPYVIIGIDKGSPARWRFDAAHELAHVILHRGAPDNPDPQRFKRMEEQAHRFAGTFLLPSVPFADDLFAANLDVMRALKSKWKVSISVMIMRARALGLVTEDVEKKLWINMSRRKWRKEEPLDDSMEIEEPRLLRRSFELIFQEGAQTPADVETRLALSPGDIEVLSGLPSGYLSGYAPVSLRNGDPRLDNVVELASRRREH